MASQVKALLTSPRVSQNPDPAGVVGFFLFGSVPEPYTTYQEIRAVPSGALMWVDQLGPRAPKTYFSVGETYAWAEQQAVPLETDAVQALVRKALLDSVRHHLVADVPVGLFLSAGVDSGSLAALVSELVDGASITTVTLAFDEFRGRQGDESLIAEGVARRYGTQHITRVVTEHEFQNDLPKILAAMDQPTIDGINTWFVSKAAREQGLKVAISGLGGDELLGSYPAFRDVPLWTRTFGIPSRIPFLGTAVRSLAELLLSRRSSVSPKAYGMMEYGGTYAGAYMLRRGLFMPWELGDLLDRDVAADGLRRLRPHHYIASILCLDDAPHSTSRRTVRHLRPKTAYAKVATLEASLYMRNQLLRDTDWASMAHSVEVRTPLVDAWLLKALAPVLTRASGFNHKALLGMAPRHPLGAGILERPKTGFRTPVEGWLERLGPVMRTDNGRSSRHTLSHWSRRWANTILPHRGPARPRPHKRT